MRHNLAFGITVFPFSWAFGPWNKGHKWLFAIGPVRLVFYRDVKGRYGESARNS